jgi:hypothetical protein
MTGSGRATAQPQRLDLEPDGLDSRIKLDRIDAPFGRAKPLHDGARIFEGGGKVGQPTCPQGRGYFKRYSVHARPPGLEAASVPQCVILALHFVRSGAEIV